jgi:hypothetical protein
MNSPLILAAKLFSENSRFLKTASNHFKEVIEDMI